MMAATLPTGRRGQALALGLTVVALALVWLGVAMPLRDAYEEGAAILAARRDLVGRMARLVDELPALEARLAAPPVPGMVKEVLLAGDNDSIAGANLQQSIQERAARAGMTLTSLEMLPATVTGGYRRIGLRVSAAATWPVLAPVLASLAQASPRLLIDDLQINGSGTQWREESPLRVSFTIQAFRAATPVATAASGSGSGRGGASSGASTP